MKPMKSLLAMAAIVLVISSCGSNQVSDETTNKRTSNQPNGDSSGTGQTMQGSSTTGSNADTSAQRAVPSTTGKTDSASMGTGKTGTTGQSGSSMRSDSSQR